MHKSRTIKGFLVLFELIIIIDVSRKPVDGSQGERQSGRPAKGNEVIGVAPVWGRPRRLRCFC